MTLNTNLGWHVDSEWPCDHKGQGEKVRRAPCGEKEEKEKRPSLFHSSTFPADIQIAKLFPKNTPLKIHKKIMSSLQMKSSYPVWDMAPSSGFLCE